MFSWKTEDVLQSPQKHCFIQIKAAHGNNNNNNSTPWWWWSPKAGQYTLPYHKKTTQKQGSEPVQCLEAPSCNSRDLTPCMVRDITGTPPRGHVSLSYQIKSQVWSVKGSPWISGTSLGCSDSVEFWGQVDILSSFLCSSSWAVFALWQHILPSWRGGGNVS